MGSQHYYRDIFFDGDLKKFKSPDTHDIEYGEIISRCVQLFHCGIIRGRSVQFHAIFFEFLVYQFQDVRFIINRKNLFSFENGLFHVGFTCS